jgi:hypothetical protein
MHAAEQSFVIQMAAAAVAAAAAAAAAVVNTCTALCLAASEGITMMQKLTEAPAAPT